MAVLTAAAASIALFGSMVGVSPPAASVCADASWTTAPFTPTWCGKKPPTGFEKSRKALDSFNEQIGIVNDVAEAAIPALDVLCDPETVNTADVDIVSARLSGEARPALAQASADLAKMQGISGAASPLADLTSVLQTYDTVITQLENAAGLARQSKCDAVGPILTSASASFATAAGLSASVQSELQALLRQQQACTSVRVVQPMAKKKVRKIAGSPAAKATRSGGIKVLYPTILNVGGKGKRLPLTVRVRTTSFVQIKLKRGKRSLAAVGGDSTNGRFGLVMKIPAKVKPGNGRLIVKYDSTDGSGFSEFTVPIRLV